MLKPGGRLVYSTCTLSREENEEVVESLFSGHAEVSPVDFVVRIGLERELRSLHSKDGLLRVYPHKVRGEGHFVALLHKGGLIPHQQSYRDSSLANTKNSDKTSQQSSGRRNPCAARDACMPSGSCNTAFQSAGNRLPPPTKPILHAYADFFRGQPCPTPNAMLGDTLLFAPDLPSLRGIKVLRAGLHLGTLKGKVFAPDHALAMVLPVPCYTDKMPALQSLPLSHAQAKAYLSGETLMMEDAPNGYVLVICEGLTLGFGKGVDGQVKNHYPKGLRVK